MRGNVGFEHTESGGGEQFLPLGCGAETTTTTTTTTTITTTTTPTTTTTTTACVKGTCFSQTPISEVGGMPLGQGCS